MKTDTKCSRCETRDEQNKERHRTRRIQQRVLNGDEEPYDKDRLIERGQIDEIPYVIGDDDPQRVALIKDDMSEHWNVGTNGTFSEIVKGKCKRCGCNRIRRDVMEPGGHEVVSCVACNASTHMEQYTDFDYELAGGE